MFEKGGEALRGVSDPMEKIFSSLTEYIGEHGMNDDMRRQYEAIGRHLNAPKVSGAVQTLKNAHQSYDLGDIYHADTSSRAATSVVPPKSTVEPTSRLRGTLSGEAAAVPSAAPTALTKTSEKSKITPNFKYYNDPNYNPDIFFGDNEHTVRAFHPDTGEEMGRLSFYGKGGITPGEIDKIEVAEKFRRQGIGTGLLEEARRLSTVDENVPYVVHSKSRTPDGEAWARSTGDTLPERTGSFDDLVEPSAPSAPVADELIEPKIVKAIENPTADEYADARARGDLIATETYDHGAEVAKATASGEPLVESPPPKPKRKGPGDLGAPTDIRTTPKPKGTDAAAPAPTSTSVTPKTPTAIVTTDTPKVKPTTPPSSGSPSKGKSLLDNAAETAKNIAKGHGNARTLGIVGAATLLGVGYASTRSKKSVQRDQGTYMDQSRRDLGY